MVYFTTGARLAEKASSIRGYIFSNHAYAKATPNLLPGVAFACHSFFCGLLRSIAAVVLL
jgi:hypothetical protein